MCLFLNFFITSLSYLRLKCTEEGRIPLTLGLHLDFFGLYIVTLSLLSRHQHQVRGEERAKIAAVISITQIYFSSDEDLSCLSPG